MFLNKSKGENNNLYSTIAFCFINVNSVLTSHVLTNPSNETWHHISDKIQCHCSGLRAQVQPYPNTTLLVQPEKEETKRACKRKPKY